MFSDIDHFWILEPDIICAIYEFLYNFLKIFSAADVISIKSFDQFDDIGNELDFFFAIFDDFSFSGLCYDSMLKVLSKELTLVLSDTRELDRVPNTK